MLVGVFAVLVAATGASCTNGGSAGTDGGGNSNGSGTDSGSGNGGNLSDAQVAELARTYGYGPPSDPSITYQPDVVLVGGGPAAIRSASADGLTWTIDGGASGAKKLRTGRVMYVTSRAVGRVVELRRADGDVVVTLAPVPLTEIYRDANLSFDQDIDGAALAYQQIPDQPGMLGTPEDSTEETPHNLGWPGNGPSAAGEPGAAPAGSSEPGSPAQPEGAAGDETVLRLAPLRFAPAAAGQLPPAGSGSVSASVGKWGAQPYHSAGKLGVKVAYNAPAGLKVGVNFWMNVDQLHLKTDARIADGIFVGEPTFAVSGIKGIGIDIAAGAANGADDNTKVRIQVPIEISVPIPGQPLVYTNSWNFSVTTALGGKNTTVKADGQWTLGGVIGVVKGHAQKPTFSVAKSIIDSISGISVGVSGIVIGLETKFQLGLGVPGASAGPYVKVGTSVGVANGSALGAPLARCVTAALSIKVGAGVGISLSPAVLAGLKSLLPAKTSIKVDVERATPIFERKQTLPDVPLCTG